MNGANVTGCNCLPSPSGETVHMAGCPYYNGQIYVSSTPVELVADPGPWTVDRVVKLLDMLAVISRRLESIEYHVRVR